MASEPSKEGSSFIRFEPGDGEVYCITDCCAFDNTLFLMTSEGRLATLDVEPRPRFELLETESYYEPATGTEVHLVDLLTDYESMLVKVSVTGTRILEAQRVL